MQIVIKHTIGVYNGLQEVSDTYIKFILMRKLILTTIIPTVIIFLIASFLAFQQYTVKESNSQTIFAARLGVLKQYWYLVLIAILTYLYMKFIVPKIFRD